MFDKLDAYNIVANLVPGAALVYALHYSGFPAPNPEKIGAFLLVAFVAGVTANRIGSLALDPLLRWKKIGFLPEKDYPAFVGLEREDEKLETLVANSGLYRTFFTAGLIYLTLLATDFWLTKIDASNSLSPVSIQ
ncbi:hypothetical protein [Sphingorhabdus sp.]|jgi:hypothetical protein|uniref:hypothetical protein n=1 Tax=Sphingorhabdus sp. TaxID=1902408 RepID=UPI0037CADA15